MYSVTIDPQLRLLHVTLRGFWDAAIMAEYMTAVRRKLAELQGSGDCRYVLIDMADFAIQSREIAEGHAKNLKLVKQHPGIRVALVMQSALSKLQAARVASTTGHRTFDTEREAMTWLVSGAE